MYALQLSLKSFAIDFGEKNKLSLLVNVSNGIGECGREIVLLFSHPSSSRYAKVEVNVTGVEWDHPCLEAVVNKQYCQVYNNQRRT